MFIKFLFESSPLFIYDAYYSEPKLIGCRLISKSLFNVQSPLCICQRAAAPQIVRRFELIKKRVRFFCLLFFCLYSARRLSYGITLLIFSSSKKYNTDETETQKLFISWRCRGNFSVMIKFRQLLTLLTTNTVVLRMTGGLVGGNQTSNFFPESSRCAGQRSVLLLSCDSRDQSI